ERLEGAGARRFGRGQQEDEVDRLAVEGLEVDRPFEPCEEAEQPVDPGRLAMGNGNAVADAGGAEALALEQRFEDVPFVEAGQLGRMCGQLLKGLFLAIDFERRQDGLRRKQIGQSHISTHRCSAIGLEQVRPVGTRQALSAVPPAGGSTQPRVPSWRRYTTFRRPLPACRNTTTGEPVRSSSITASLTDST